MSMGQASREARHGAWLRFSVLGLVGPSGVGLSLFWFWASGLSRPGNGFNNVVGSMGLGDGLNRLGAGLWGLGHSLVGCVLLEIGLGQIWV